MYTIRTGAVIAFAVLAACSRDRAVPVAPAAAHTATSDKISVWFDAEPADAAGTVQLALHLSSPTLPIGAYQGAITYDPSALQFVSDAKSDGDYTALNPLTPQSGIIRFAGFSAMGVQDAVIVRIVVRPLRKLSSKDMGARFDVVGSVDGKRLPLTNVVVSERAFTAR